VPCDWEGNRRSGVALAMRHRLQWFIHLQAHGLRKGDEHPANTPHGVGHTLPVLYSICTILCKHNGRTMMISDKKSEINLCQVWNVAFVDADTLNDDKNTERHDTQINSENKPYNKVSSRGRRNDMPPRRWQFDGGKNRGGSTSVRGRVRSAHISGGRWWLSCRQPACL